MARTSWIAGAVLLCAVLLAGRKWMLSAYESSESVAHVDRDGLKKSRFNLTILHTNDLHSSVTGVGPESMPQKKKGGYARMANFLKSMRQDPNWNYLTVDAGDWYAGSLFDRLGPNRNSTCVPELEYFHASGYDAVNLGNHDFDATDHGLALMLEKAQSNGLKLNFLSSNIRAAPGPIQDVLHTKHANVTLKPYSVKEFFTGDRVVRIGIVGLLGPDAALCSTSVRGTVTFAGFNEVDLKKDIDEFVASAHNTITALRANENVDHVVVLLHGGPEESRALTAAVPGIDVIVSGHTHQSYYRSMAHEGEEERNTHVVQCGHSGKLIGVLRLYTDDDNTLKLASTHECVSLDASIEEDTHVKSLVGRWKGELPLVMNSTFSYEQVVYRAPDGLVFNSSMSFKDQATLVSTLLLRQVNRYLRDLDQPEADVYLTCPTCVRSRVHASSQGEVVLQFSDVYRMLSISTKCDMVVFYMRREDLWMTLNIVLILEKALSDTFVLTLGGVHYDFSDWGLPFINYFKNLRLVRDDGSAIYYEEWPPLVRVATSTYIAKHIFKAKKYSFGIVAAPARDAFGNEVTLSDSIVPSIPPEYRLLAEFLHSTSASAMLPKATSSMF